MPFDPTLPQAGSLVDAVEMRAQLNALKALIDAQAASVAALGATIASQLAAISSQGTLITSQGAQITSQAAVISSQGSQITSLQAAISGTAQNPSMSTLSISFSNPVQQSEGQSVQDAFNTLLNQITRV